MSDMFDSAVEFVLKWEGGYVCDPNDRGGETNWGVARRNYPNLDIKALTKDDAKAIYRRDYWDRCRCGEMPWGVALVVFDTAVNQGVRAASIDLQSVLRVRADGIVGPVTMSALTYLQRETTVDDLAAMLTAERMFRYVCIAVNHPNDLSFAKGWMRRVIDCLCRAMEGE